MSLSDRNANPTIIKTITPVITFATGAYSAGDQLGAAPIALAGVAKGGLCSIVSACYACKVAGATSLALNLLFFSTTVAHTSADNEAFNPSDADVLAYFTGSMSLGAPQVLANNIVQTGTTTERVLRSDDPVTGTIYVMPIVTAAWTPGSADDIKITMAFRQLSAVI
jgi:hypothetical protein